MQKKKNIIENKKPIKKIVNKNLIELQNKREEETKKKENKKKDESKDNEQNKKAKRKQLKKEMRELNKLYYITDIYFFDSEQAVKLFDAHYKMFTTDKTHKVINKSKLYDYFIKGIASGTEAEVHGDKAGLFLDEFNKFYIVRASRKKANKKEYDSQPYPKINHKNLNMEYGASSLFAPSDG